MIHKEHWCEALDLLPLGVLMLDSKGRVRSWNAWLAKRTSIEHERARGRTLAELFPGFDNPRFESALAQVFGNGAPQVLSQMPNGYLIPIGIPSTERNGVRGDARHGIALMQQQVQLSPLPSEKGLCLLSISAVTGNVTRSAADSETARTPQESSLRDPLTSLYNRNFMWEWLWRELKQARRHGYPVACLMLDIDYFKAIIDTLGRDGGGQVLAGFATLLDTQAQLRGSDVLVRYGEEEFVVLLPHCNLYQGVRKAEHILEMVRLNSIGALGSGRIRCSIGAAVCDPGYLMTAEELLKGAELRLYEAKESGNDRVCPELAAAGPEGVVGGA